MSVRIVGADDARAGIQRVLDRVDETPEYVAEKLDEGMREVVHVVSGHLRSTIYHRGAEAGATAAYAGIEADRGDMLAGGKTGHDFDMRAVDDLDMEALADWIVEVF